MQNTSTQMPQTGITVGLGSKGRDAAADAVLQAAAPVGKWVVQQSFKAALGLMTSDSGSRKREKRQHAKDSED
jgi:hypothetical protein